MIDNKIPKYEGGEKLCDYNYEIKFFENKKLYFDADKCGARRDADFRLSIIANGQHDGRLWDKEWLEQYQTRLVDEIMFDLRKEIEAFVVNAKPFAIHC